MSYRKLVTMMAAVAVAALVLIVGVEVHALIDPNFTPIHITEQSDYVILLKFDDKIEKGVATATITKALKGEAPGKSLKIDLMAGAFEAQGKSISAIIKSGKTDAIMFVGFFEGGGDEGEEPGENAAGMLLIDNSWINLEYFEEDIWDLVKINPRLLATWNGTVESLVQCVSYVIADEDADIPVRTEATLDKPIKIGKVEGKVHGAGVVDLAGDGKLALFVGSEGGDRLFITGDKGKSYKDVTSAKKLASRSAAWAWGDFNGDGRSDLASSAGKGVTVHTQGADGVFTSASADTTIKGVSSLSTLGTSIVVGSVGWPVLLTPGGGAWTAKAIAKGKMPTDGFGPAANIFAADFDGDAVADIIQLYGGGGLYFKGSGKGGFAAPAATRMGIGRGPADACVGDFDQNGLLDIFCVAADSNKIYQNRGGGKFNEIFGYSGEPSYISKPGGIECGTSDVNNDGRQDFLMIYPKMVTQTFFNRGFSSFGHSHMMDIADHEQLPAAEDGQQAGCFGDLNGDGAQDLALVLLDGAVYVLHRAAEEDNPPLALTVALPAGVPGPVNVKADLETRSLGTWTMKAGSDRAFFGMREAGPLTITWQFPGEKPRKKEIVLEDGPVRYVVKPKK